MESYLPANYANARSNSVLMIFFFAVIVGYYPHPVIPVSNCF